MVSSTTAIAICNAAETAIGSHVVRTIDTLEYTKSTARNLKNDLIAAAQNVPTTLAGGDNGHTYLLESQEDHHARTGANKDYVEATRPAPISFTGATTAADVAHLREDQAGKEGLSEKEQVQGSRQGCQIGSCRKVPAIDFCSVCKLPACGQCFDMIENVVFCGNCHPEVADINWGQATVKADIGGNSEKNLGSEDEGERTVSLIARDL